MLPDKDRLPRWAKNTANVATRTWGWGTASWRSGPDFLVVGTKRGGTTSLWNNLLRHPEVAGLFPQNRGRKSTDHYFEAGGSSLRWYRSHFPTRRQVRHNERLGLGLVAGEASPYYMYGPHCLESAARDFPDVKVIMLLRDPVERAYSHFQERRKQGTEPLDFEAALAAEPLRLAPDESRWLHDPAYYSAVHDHMSYRSRGVYLPQVRRALEVFPRDQVLIMRSEDFYSGYQQAFDRVCGFLGVTGWDLQHPEHHNRIPRSPMAPETRAELRDFYAPFNAELQEYLAVDFQWQAPGEPLPP